MASPNERMECWLREGRSSLPTGIREFKRKKLCCFLKMMRYASPFVSLTHKQPIYTVGWPFAVRDCCHKGEFLFVRRYRTKRRIVRVASTALHPMPTQPARERNATTEHDLMSTLHNRCHQHCETVAPPGQKTAHQDGFHNHALQHGLKKQS